ncbi:sensor histidine kinase [Paenibacillus doosanensis]|uniref:cache domain-containing sensor histidine kinase n=1 Tax=Paenibacillus doosanensis TaxID=1229154 RepID=UPI00217F2969|nr:sensor histidine kinase [Paenibacillus doosanensis]MCS7459555.1 sensor histidine kinase [Paenibacillus doosanensis]
MRRGLHSIHNRLFFLFLICMLSLLLVVSGLYYKRWTDQFHQKFSDIAQKNVYQTVELFDLLLQGYNSLAKSIAGNLDMQRLMADENNKDSALKAINERTIVNILGSIFYSREDLIGIHVISNGGALYSYGSMMSVIDPKYAESSWYRAAERSTGELVWFGVHEHSLIDQKETQPVFSFGRRLYDFHTHQPIGVLLIEMNPKPVVSALSNLSLGAHSEVYMLSKVGEVMGSAGSSPGDSKLLKQLGGRPPLMQEHEVVVRETAGLLVVASRPALADWQFVSLTPSQDMNVEMDQMKHYLLLVGSILVAVSTVMATLVSKSFAAPLKRLIHQMKQVERGNFHGVVSVNSYEEINILVASFNQMVARMGELIGRIRAVSESEKNAQLLALQSQVNPHFLYNTLDMIYWMLDEQENDRLGRVVLSLSHMFRYSSHWEGDSVVSLGEELEQIRHYLTIIETRLEGRLRTEIAVDERWLAMRLPKMTLQPLIENAVKHGLEPMHEAGRLRVYGEADDAMLRLFVEDNGPGMDEPTLRRLKRTLSDSLAQGGGERALEESAAAAEDRAAPAHASAAAKPRRGIGLQNVHRRLVLMFGEPYGLDIRSRRSAGRAHGESRGQGQGTTVVVTIPLNVRQEQERGPLHEHPGGG